MSYPGHNLELSIVNYLSGSTISTSSLLSGSNASFYTAYDNLDVINPPIVIVDCSEFNELYYNSRNYEFVTKVYIKEMAADTQINQLGVLAQSVLNEFADSNTASQNFTNRQSYNVATWQCQPISIRSEREGDALITEAAYRIIGALVPSS